MTPIIFVHESSARGKQAEQSKDTVLLYQRQGLAAIFVGMASRKGADVFGQIVSQRAALVVHQGWLVLLPEKERSSRHDACCGFPS